MQGEFRGKADISVRSGENLLTGFVSGSLRSRLKQGERAFPCKKGVILRNSLVLKLCHTILIMMETHRAWSEFH